MLGSVDALSTLRGDGQKDSVLEGLHLLQATSAEPNPVKFKLIGTELNIDAGSTYRFLFIRSVKAISF